MSEDGRNPWPGLAQQAHAGNLELKPGAAREGARLAAIAANALIYAKSYQDILTTHKGFSDNEHLYQVLILKKRFNEQGLALGPILDRYIELVNGMADTMIQADKTYDVAEVDSKTKFDQLKKAADAKDTDPAKPSLDHGKIFDLGGDSAPRIDQHAKGNEGLYKVAHEQGHYEAIDPENPYAHHDLDWFYEAGAGMDPQTVANFSATWAKVAKKVDDSFEALTKQLTKMVDDKDWSSAGAQSAVDAANTFKKQATDLTDNLRSMAENLKYVSGWLENTKVMMPRNKPTDFDYDHYQRMENMIKAAQLAFQHWYVPGLTGAGQAVPRLTDPTAPKPHLDGPGGRSNNGGGDGRSGGNGGGQNRAGGASMPNLGNMPNNKINPNGVDPNGTNPNGTNPNGIDPNGTNPNGIDPNGTNPNGTNPNGTNPNGTNPNGTNPQGNPSGTNPNSNSGQSSQGMSQLSSALQQGMQGLTSLQTTEQQKKQQQELKDKLKDSPLAGMPNLEDLKKGLGGGGRGGGGGGGGAPKPMLETSRLFPRAALAETAESTSMGVARAGVAAGSTGMGGMGGGGGMGPMGHGAGGQGQGGKDHKRPEFLDSSEYLDEAMGTAPVVAKPVVEG
ncbi:WXG100 family type VII secretion target [Nocardia sp. NPDC056611]|uniref:WXG100 family type VII secretion target n=1 Tax=Nocardia sp. NPDC056611 TaxID=3345877 RepID=UPI00366E4209